MLTGQAKTDYMREYMRKRRASIKPVRPMLDPPIMLDPVRPKVLDPVRPKQRKPVRPANISDSQYNYICMKSGHAMV